MVPRLVFIAGAEFGARPLYTQGVLGVSRGPSGRLRRIDFVALNHGKCAMNSRSVSFHPFRSKAVLCWNLRNRLIPGCLSGGAQVRNHPQKVIFEVHPTSIDGTLALVFPGPARTGFSSGVSSKGNCFSVGISRLAHFLSS